MERNGHAARGGVLRAVLRHPELTLVGGAVALGLLIWVLAYLQPWLTFVDREIHEPRPAGRVFATAAFNGARGSVALLELADGQRVLRIEGLDVENGPALHVMLSPSDGTSGAVPRDEGFDLGALRGNVGDMTYEIPGLVDLRRYASIAIVSRRSGAVRAYARLAS